MFSDLHILCHTVHYVVIHFLVADEIIVCEAENDTIWNIEWPATNVGVIASQKCPGLSESIGEIGLCKYHAMIYKPHKRIYVPCHCS